MGWNCNQVQLVYTLPTQAVLYFGGDSSLRVHPSAYSSIHRLLFSMNHSPASLHPDTDVIPAEQRLAVLPHVRIPAVELVVKEGQHGGLP
jgi:hypothetical protein